MKSSLLLLSLSAVKEANDLKCPLHHSEVNNVYSTVQSADVSNKNNINLYRGRLIFGETKPILDLKKVMFLYVTNDSINHPSRYLSQVPLASASSSSSIVHDIFALERKLKEIGTVHIITTEKLYF